jgi:hypothetical protein
MEYFIIIKGIHSRTIAEDITFHQLNLEEMPIDGISIQKVGWMSDWGYTRLMIDSNTLEPSVVEARLNDWLTRRTQPPFAMGDLLWWTRSGR